MKRLVGYFLQRGFLTFLGVFVCVILGFSLVYVSVEFLPYVWLKVLGLSLGLGLAAIGGFSGRASALGLTPPFTNDPLGWRKAKKSYQPQSPESSSEDQAPKP